MAVIHGLVLLLLAAGCTAMDWKPCGDAAGDIKSVTLAPDPPAPGVTVQFSIEANSAIDVDTGLLNIAVSYRGMDIFAEAEDICDKTACPIKKGPLVIAYNQYLPPIVPPGPYAVTINATSTIGEQLLCIVVDFEVTPPTASAVAGAAAGKAKRFLGIDKH